MKKGIIIFVILILFIGAIITGTLLWKPKKEDPPKDPYIDRAKELINNNDILSYLYYGNIKTTDSFKVVDNIRYEYIEDEKLNEIKSITDIMNLIDNTFTEEQRVVFINNLNNENYNRYIMESGILLVAKSKNVCSKMQREANEIKYTEEDEKIIISAYGGIEALKRENNIYLTGLAYSCE